MEMFEEVKVLRITGAKGIFQGEVIENF